MSKLIQVSGKAISVEQITHAGLGKEQITISPVEYHDILLMGKEMEQAVSAMEAAGFIRQDDWYINPRRVAVLEYHSENLRVYLEGAVRILYIGRSFLDKMTKFLAPESVEAPVVEDIKPRRVKKAA